VGLHVGFFRALPFLSSIAPVFLCGTELMSLFSKGSVEHSVEVYLHIVFLILKLLFILL
jgi:hypothetical protein